MATSIDSGRPSCYAVATLCLLGAHPRANIVFFSFPMAPLYGVTIRCQAPSDPYPKRACCCLSAAFALLVCLFVCLSGVPFWPAAA